MIWLKRLLSLRGLLLLPIVHEILKSQVLSMDVLKIRTLLCIPYLFPVSVTSLFFCSVKTCISTTRFVLLSL